MDEEEVDVNSVDDLFPFAQNLALKIKRQYQLKWNRQQIEDAQQELFLAGWQVWQETGELGLAKNRMMDRRINLLRDFASELKHEPRCESKIRQRISEEQAAQLWEPEALQDWESPLARSSMRGNPLEEAAVREFLDGLSDRQRRIVTMRMTANVIEAGILAFMGCESLAEKHLGAQTAQYARDLRATSLLDLCRTSLQADGRDIPQGKAALIRAALSTYSLPNALGNAAGKVLMDSYTESPATWRSFASIKSTNDFKQHQGIRPSQTGELEEVAKGGELKHGSLAEAVFGFSVDTFGKNIGIDPNVLAATWRVYMDYGAALGDFRAAYKAKGEA